MLDYLQNDTIRTAPGSYLPVKEQERLRPHQQAWLELKRQWMTMGGCEAPTLTQKALAALPSSLSAESLLRHGRAKMDIMVAALKCQTRRVCTLLWQPAGPRAINPISGARDHFDLSLANDAASLEARRQIDTWYANQFAYLLERLEQSKLLDQTVVVWCSEVAEGQHHNNMTFVAAGGAALGLAQAKTLAFPFAGAESDGLKTARLASNRSVADLWLTLLALFDYGATSYGDPDASGEVMRELLSP